MRVPENLQRAMAAEAEAAREARAKVDTITIIVIIIAIIVIVIVIITIIIIITFTIIMKVIAAEGEHKASRALKHAAEVIADSPAALQVIIVIVIIIVVIIIITIIIITITIIITSSYFQLRYLQTLNSISAENNSTIIFPVPIDVMSQVVELINKLFKE